MGIFLIFGSASAIASGETDELTRALDNVGIRVELSSSPTILEHRADAYSFLLLVADTSMPPMADMWGSFFKGAGNFKAAAWVATLIPKQFTKFFKFEKEWNTKDTQAIDSIVSWAKAAPTVAAGEPIKAFAKPPLPKGVTGTGYESVTGVLNPNEPKLAGAVVIDQAEDPTSIFVDDAAPFTLDLNEEPNDKPHRFGEPVSEILSLGELDEFGLGEINQAEPRAPSVAELSIRAFEPGDGLSLNQDHTHSPFESVDGDETGMHVAPSPLSESLDVKDLGRSTATPKSLHGPAQSDDDSQGSQVVKRYALLKEKENREKQKTIDILRSELEKAKASQHGIQSEKRKLMLKVDEIEADRRALQETVDELRHQVSLGDNATTQKVRDYQMRLENSQFMVKRLEKKLEDFKLRVRLDIQKIRARERELENRLELQKRDAEALISTKDSRLLNQKREIDRLHFEMEILKERLVEETEKAEDRNEKLHRAVQSLKMAQGMLSGIDEEVIATTERTGDGSDGEAA